MALAYHQATVQLLDYAPDISGDALMLLTDREADLGVRFPASVREWYGMEGAVDLLSGNMDHVVPIDRLGAPLYDLNGRLRNFVPDGLLVFLNENQHVVQWALRLDGTDDPEVLVCVEKDTGGCEWRHCADHFSTFAYTRVWDWYGGFWDDDCTLQAQDRELAPADLSFLEREFAAGPRTFGWPGRTTYRFSADEAQILIWDDEIEQADWFIWAAHRVALARVVGHVWNCGTLSSNLYDMGDCGKIVLAKLRQQG